MHILNQVQSIYIKTCQPIHHAVKFGNNILILQNIASYAAILRSNLVAALLINTTVNSIEQALSQVGTSTEELHLLTSLSCRYAAADGVIIAPLWLHSIIVLILDGAGGNGNLSCIALEVLRQRRGIQNSQIWLWGWSHILQGMEETVIVLGYHVTAINTSTAYLQGSPYRIAGE